MYFSAPPSIYKDFFILMSSTLLKVAIIGEGVIGVSTALAIRQALPKAVIKIFSDRPFEDTTSFGPAGIFRFNEDRYKSWAEKTFNFWAKLEREESPLNTGGKYF
uniref:FAD dependent oxidoreductase domain-containing protein n=1 Tax=Meloidogyne enterolobii TaxID=390850 RepID=A0A6V7XL26_MELEN|nr:unnamed protein product [Meloidogyne enterolobii]